MMADKLPVNIKGWTSDCIEKYLKKHMSNSKYNEADVEKIKNQNTDGEASLGLTIQILTIDNGPFKIKYGNATDIMKLVGKLKGKTW